MMKSSEGLALLKKNVSSARMKERLSKRDRMIVENVPLVIKIACKYRHGESDTFEELVDEGIIGLIKAVDKYDETVGRFSTYATYWIRSYMESYLNERNDDVTLPKGMCIYIRHVHLFIREHDRKPTAEELMKISGCSMNSALSAIEYADKKYVGLDSLGNHELEFGVGCYMDDLQDDGLALELVNKLPRDYGLITAMYSGLYKHDDERVTMEEVADTLGQSKQRIGQVISDVRSILRGSILLERLV